MLQSCNDNAGTTRHFRIYTDEAIMLKVAGNQDRAEKLRNEYVYQQHIRVVTRRTNGKLAREEVTDYRVAPTPDGNKKEMKHIDGRYWHQHRYLDFHGEPVPGKDTLDSAIVESFRDDLLNSKPRTESTRIYFP
jgi:hypothetical protein